MEPTLIHGCEAWIVTKRILKKIIEAVDMWFIEENFQGTINSGKDKYRSNGRIGRD